VLSGSGLANPSTPCYNSHLLALYAIDYLTDNTSCRTKPDIE
jgi:hypothetical protein